MNITKISAFAVNRKSIRKDYRKIKFNNEEKEVFNTAKEKFDYTKTKPVSTAIKRACDIVGGTIALALTAPIMLAGAIAVKLESKGPAIFKQKRIGKDGKPFTMYKLRTMHDNPANNGYNVENADDSRITKVGKFLRKYSIDEFPQFINIIKGDMSLVGPRPLPDYEHNLTKKFPQFAERYIVKPGAKLQYSKKELDDPQKRFEIEKNYIENWSLVKDAKILTRIVSDVIRGKNY